MACISTESTFTKNSRTDESVGLRIPLSQPLEDLHTSVEHHEQEPNERNGQQQRRYCHNPHIIFPFCLWLPFDEEAEQLPASQQEHES